MGSNVVKYWHGSKVNTNGINTLYLVEHPLAFFLFNSIMKVAGEEGAPETIGGNMLEK